MRKPLGVLIVEDSEDDAVLVLRELRRGGYDPVFERVDTAAALEAALCNRAWDVIISDYALPSFNALGALAVVHRQHLDLPFIIVSGKIGEDVAVAAMKAGAHDYIMKDKLARLGPAIERELREAEVRAQRRQAEEALRRARDELERRVEERTRELNLAKERMEQLSHRLIAIQEDERRHLARELHDEVGQPLAALTMTLHAMQHLPDQRVLAPQLEATISIAEDLQQQVRDLWLDLRPSLLDDLGLVSTLRWYVDRVAQRTGLAAHVVADPLEQRLCPEIETTCFRVVQEALTNVVQHAQAHVVRVEVRQHATEVEICIQDDGVGFDVGKLREGDTSVGLLSMQERVELAGGQLDVESSASQGTTIRARFPLD